MPTNASTFTTLAGPQAIVLAEQIDGTPNADTLTKIGFAYPVAIELARQAVAGTGDLDKLIALGISPQLAGQIKAAIDA